MTREEAKRIIEDGIWYKGAAYKSGYCCYQNDNISKYEMDELGSNSGVYGWNWTLYYSPSNNTYYCNSYRNAPAVSYPANYKYNPDYNNPAAGATDTINDIINLLDKVETMDPAAVKATLETIARAGAADQLTSVIIREV